MIRHLVELSCDFDGCDAAYAPGTDAELVDAVETRKGARAAGWTRADGDRCPQHNPDAALIALVTSLAARGRTDTEIAEFADRTRAWVQKFRARYSIPAGVKPGRPAHVRRQPRRDDQ